MTDVERRVTEFLREEADRAALPAGMYERVVRKAKIRRAATLGLGALGLAAIVFAGTAAMGTLRSPASIGPAGSPETSSPSATPREVGGCPLTTPSRPPFVPPEPYPSEAPELYQKEWHGTAELWTMLGSEGEVWRDLPDDDGDGRFTEKTFWWSEGLSDRSLSPITVTGRRLDKPGSFETGGPGGGGFREDIGSFMLVGIEIPAGCWELTATYRGAELSYVVLVEP